MFPGGGKESILLNHTSSTPGAKPPTHWRFLLGSGLRPESPRARWSFRGQGRPFWRFGLEGVNLLLLLARACGVNPVFDRLSVLLTTCVPADKKIARQPFAPRHQIHFRAHERQR